MTPCRTVAACLRSEAMSSGFIVNVFLQPTSILGQSLRTSPERASFARAATSLCRARLSPLLDTAGEAGRPASLGGRPSWRSYREQPCTSANVVCRRPHPARATARGRQASWARRDPSSALQRGGWSEACFCEPASQKRMVLMATNVAEQRKRGSAPAVSQRCSALTVSYPHHRSPDACKL